MKLKRSIEFTPGYDYIVQPTKDRGAAYGRHGLTMRFLVEGEKGVIQFLLFTGWLPLVKEGFSWKPTYDGSIEPMAADVGYHSYTPMYKDQNTMKGECKYLHNKRCYYGGSGILAEEYFAELCNKGEEALWNKMEECYEITFNKK